MKLRTQFGILVAIFCIIIILAGVSATITSQQVRRITEQEHLANSIVTGAYELSYLSTDYLIHPGEERQGLQWESRFKSLSDEIYRLEVNTPEEKVLVSQIQVNMDRLHEVYTQSVETIDAARAVPGEPVDTGLVQVIWSRIVVQNQGIIFDASRLSRLLHDEGEKWQNLNTIIIFILMGAFLVIFLITYLFINRRILRSISSLQEGTCVIGSGNLDYTIEKKGDDEIGNLTDDFNAMTSSLKQVTASKQELEEEIAQRKAFELAQKESEIRFTELFDTISSGVAIYAVINDGMSGSDYIIRNFNKSALEIEGRTKEDVVGKSLKDLRPAIDDYGLIPVFREVWKTGMPAYYPVKIYIDEKYANYYENRVFRLPSGGIVAIYNDLTGQKRAEDLVRETKEYLENLIRNASAPIMTWDPDFRITDFNRAFELLTGLKRENVLGQSLDILFPAESCETSMDLIHRTARGEEWEAVEIPIRGESGMNRIVLWNLTALKNKEGATIATVAQGLDITDRKAAEDLLRTTVERLHKSQVLGLVGSWEYDLETGKIWASDEGFHIYGMLPPEGNIMPVDAIEACIPERVMVHQALVDLIEQGKPYHLEFSINPTDGSNQRVITSVAEVIRDKDGRPKKVVGVIQDITERKASEEALHKSERTYRNLVESISDVLFSISPDYIITYISPVVKIFGLTIEEMKGRSFHTFIFPDDLQVVQDGARDVLSGRDVDIEFRLRTPAGDIFHVHVAARPEWKDGKVAGIAGIMKDITSKKDLDRLKVEALQKIEENLIQMAALNDQIRNPLAVIMATADMAGGPTAEAIIRQVKEIDAMINELDRKWVESTKVREFLKKYYGVKG